ncbi:hypothetical protein GCM10007962_23930 [Yeosuana aromativorans]|uniref:BioF2-like acetyltransferase domain-containing protein n=1 Tax=Yeosuana aromativorans TaxID=288019 RepID=A0A8J3BUB4_9FLAO|nr:GNAT family N-acetyltransferase [Yeosuana aromativorans]GGK28926.1 hypothetical protein GCM10007962_23930 [Yeosuana aromativorans]
MKDNPFISNTFASIWLKYFNNGRPAIDFKFITNISFVKTKLLPLYVNVGKNLTNGLNYVINKDETDYKNKVFFVYDIPEYLNLKIELTNGLKLKTVRQYIGYLVDLSKYKNADDYLKTHLSSNSRWKINKSKKRLETCFNITYGVLYGKETKKEDFDYAFDYFNKLLQKRFVEKQINNHYLSPKKWSYLQELIYNLILENKAALFVIYNDTIPISVYLNYVSSNVLYSALPVFDPDYSKFNLGYIDNLKHIEWCYKNNIDIFDFSKGDYDYKKRLGNKEYYFDYHILYDSKSIRANLLCQFIYFYFSGKQALRDLNIHILYHKVIFFLKRNQNKNVELEYKRIDIKNLPNDTQLTKLDFNSLSNSVMKKSIIEFLYKSSESVNDISIFKSKEDERVYFLRGKSITEKIILKNK